MDHHKRSSSAQDILSILTEVIQIKDPYTFDHCMEVGKLCNNFSRFLNLDVQTVDHLKMAGTIHDIGKVFVDQHILIKPMGLSNEEYEKIKNHSKIGADLIQHMDELMFLYPSILFHHERWDGRGYPQNLIKRQIPITSRILSICDCCHALLSDRPYRKKLSMEKTKEILSNEREKQFDPQLLDQFFDFMLSKDFTLS